MASCKLILNVLKIHWACADRKNYKSCEGKRFAVIVVSKEKKFIETNFNKLLSNSAGGIMLYQKTGFDLIDLFKFANDYMTVGKFYPQIIHSIGTNSYFRKTKEVGSCGNTCNGIYPGFSAVIKNR